MTALFYERGQLRQKDHGIIEDMDSLPELYDLLYKNSPDLSLCCNYLPLFGFKCFHQKIRLDTNYDGKKNTVRQIRESNSSSVGPLGVAMPLWRI